MYIDPIHAGPVALAHAFALAARVSTQRADSVGTAAAQSAPRTRRFKSLMRLAWWSRLPDAADFPTADPVQLMLWSECAGRPEVTALGGLLVMNFFRRNSAAARQTSTDGRQGALCGLPEGRDQPADDDQCATEHYRQGRCGSKDDVVDQLPHDKQRRDVQPDQLPEFQGRQVDDQPITKEQDRTAQEPSQANGADMVVDSHAHDSVATHLEYGRD